MKKLLLICSLLCTFALVGCSSKPTVKDVPVNDIKESILSKNLIDIPFNEIDAKDFYVFESVNDKIDEGFVINAMMNVKLRDVFVVKTSDAQAVTKAIED